MYAYRFENLSGRSDELADALIAFEEKGRPLKDVEKAGNMIIFSSRNMEPREVYRLYKLRSRIENCFDTAKNVLSADRTYMSSDEKISGHAFITFLSLCIWTELNILIENAGLSSQLTVTDVLDIYASAKRVVVNGRDVKQTVGGDLKKLDSDLRLFMYSEEHVPKKRGRKPKAVRS